MSEKTLIIEQLDDLAELHDAEIPTTGTVDELKIRLAEWQAKPLPEPLPLPEPPLSLETVGYIANFTFLCRDESGVSHLINRGQTVSLDEATTATLMNSGAITEQ